MVDAALGGIFACNLSVGISNGRERPKVCHLRPVDTDSTPLSYTAADSNYGDFEKLHPWNPSSREEKRNVHFAPINRASMYLKIGRRGYLASFQDADRISTVSKAEANRSQRSTIPSCDGL